MKMRHMKVQIYDVKAHVYGEKMRMQCS
eukprot:COSAG02_NODE_43782_length_371_cov_2.209559_1_plen_27_part_10